MATKPPYETSSGKWLTRTLHQPMVTVALYRPPYIKLKRRSIPLIRVWPTETWWLQIWRSRQVSFSIRETKNYRYLHKADQAWWRVITSWTQWCSISKVIPSISIRHRQKAGIECIHQRQIIRLSEIVQLLSISLRRKISILVQSTMTSTT